jgi:hypothetical protein
LNDPGHFGLSNCSFRFSLNDFIKINDSNCFSQFFDFRNQNIRFQDNFPEKYRNLPRIFVHDETFLIGPPSKDVIYVFHPPTKVLSEIQSNDQDSIDSEYFDKYPSFLGQMHSMLCNYFSFDQKNLPRSITELRGFEPKILLFSPKPFISRTIDFKQLHFIFEKFQNQTKLNEKQLNQLIEHCQNAIQKYAQRAENSKINGCDFIETSKTYYCCSFFKYVHTIEDSQSSLARLTPSFKSHFTKTDLISSLSLSEQKLIAKYVKKLYQCSLLLNLEIEIFI